VDVRQLRLLRTLGEVGSVTAVAESLRLTPSAVSQQLKALERRAGVPLTHRRDRRLVLTEAGERLAGAVAEIDVALARAETMMHDLRETPRGEVSVAAFSSAALAFFPPLVAAFPTDGPVTVSVTDEDTSQRDFPRLTTAYDVVLAHRFPHTAPWPDTVHVFPLMEEPLDVALPAAHPLATAESLTAADVVGEGWIVTHQGWPVGAIVEALAVRSGRPLTVRHRVNEFSVVAALVRAGAGLALLPRWTSTTPPGVILRPLVDIHAARQIDALLRPEQTLRPEVGTVLDVLQHTAQDLGAVAVDR